MERGQILSLFFFSLIIACVVYSNLSISKTGVKPLSGHIFSSGCRSVSEGHYPEIYYFVPSVFFLHHLFLKRPLDYWWCLIFTIGWCSSWYFNFSKRRYISRSLISSAGVGHGIVLVHPTERGPVSGQLESASTCSIASTSSLFADHAGIPS